MNMLKSLLLAVVLLIAGTVAFVASGVYNVAADVPHWQITSQMLGWMRDRSIAVRADGIDVPALEDEALVISGAGNYDAMCMGCHLAPGTAATEASAGLYPAPPDWRALGELEPAKAFWVVKHGIKATGMPAWGKSMDDRYVWGMVAFMQRFPGMTAKDYRRLVDASPGHSHGGGETGNHDQHGDEHNRSSFEPIEDPMAATASDGANESDDEHHQHDH